MIIIIIIRRSCNAGCGNVVRKVVDKIGEDWVFLFLLGTIMAVLSFLLDFCIAKFLEGKAI